MGEAVYFGVVRLNGVESPRKFYEQVPRGYVEKSRRHELIYVTRIDNQPNGDGMVTAPLDELFRRYRHLRDGGKLPPDARGK